MINRECEDTRAAWDKIAREYDRTSGYPANPHYS
jgi:hypothetical protein